jgi:hypothetical protein
MKRVSLIFLVVLILGVGNAFASPTFNIDFYGLAGLDQGVFDTGQTIILTDPCTVNVALYLSDPDMAANGGLAGYGLQISYDGSLVLQGPSSAAAPVGWFDMGSTVGAGYINMTALHFPPYPTTTDVLLAQFALTYDGLTTGTAPIILYDLNPGDYADTMYGNFELAPIDGMLPVTVGTIASAVPIPAAIWILGSGLLGLLGLRRKFSA